MDDDTESDVDWNAGRDLAHLTAHAGQQRPCCAPILARLATMDTRNVEVLQFAYFQRGSEWLATVDLPLEIGLKFLATPRQRELAKTTGDARREVVGILRAAGHNLWCAAVGEYEGRSPAESSLRTVRERDRRASQWIYFVRGEGTGLVKIGVTIDVGSRMSTLRVGSPVPLSLLAVMPGGEAIEAALHARFADLHSHGEWFRESPELLALIESVASRPVGDGTIPDA